MVVRGVAVGPMAARPLRAGCRRGGPSGAQRRYCARRGACFRRCRSGHGSQGFFKKAGEAFAGDGVEDVAFDGGFDVEHGGRCMPVAPLGRLAHGHFK